MKERIISASLIAVSIVIFGLLMKAGIDNFVSKDNKVSVKGLSEKEVPANRVIWPILSKELGNDLPELYNRIDRVQTNIKRFLIENGISEQEITINAPSVIDMNADQYSSNQKKFRYNITSSITVTSNKVDLVRQIIAKQGDLLKEGIAIVDGGYENPVRYDYVSFNDMKPQMMQEAIANAEQTAKQFATNSGSSINKIISADQGQFSIEDRDANTPFIKKIRVVTSVTYSLKN